MSLAVNSKRVYPKTLQYATDVHLNSEGPTYNSGGDIMTNENFNTVIQEVR